jgi:TAG lipase / steryl ester hydrolase / phospholipase A2 / LPA acyltransferase
VRAWCSELHENFPVVPEPIREYIDEVKLHLQHITESDGLDLPTKLDFLRETRHAFGRTALVLSGGGALGAFHIVRPCLKARVKGGVCTCVLPGCALGASLQFCLDSGCWWTVDYPGAELLGSFAAGGRQGAF